MVCEDESSGRVFPDSGYVLLHSDGFSNLTEIPSRGYNRLFKAERYGKVFLLKCLKAEYVHDPLFQALLHKEFELLLAMNHPNIVRAYSLESVNDFGLCIVMEYVDGFTLDRFLAQKPSAAQRKKVLRQLLDALRHIHSHQQMHRDLKPSNLMVTRNDSDLKIIDFGFSDADHYVAFKESAYSPKFASPEQIDNLPLDCRSDIYSFGLILKMIFPRRYYRVIRRCTQYRREKRYRDVGEVSKALFSPWPAIIRLCSLLALIVLIAFGLHKYKHFNSEPFSAKVPSGQLVNFQIRDSRAYVVDNAAVEGDLVIPAKVRCGIFSFPVVGIDDGAFYQDKNLLHVRLPEGLQSIGEFAFMECSNLTDSLVLPESLRVICNKAFNATGICHLIVKCKTLENQETTYFFSDCNNLETVDIEPSVCSLCDQLLHNMNEKFTVTFHNSMTELQSAVLAQSDGLLKVVFPRDLKTLKTSCFYGATIPRLILPESVESIEGYVFRCSDIKCLDIGPNVKEIGAHAMSNMIIDTLIIRAPRPPKHNGEIFWQINPDFVFLVPKESLPLYMADTVYANIHPVGI